MRVFVHLTKFYDWEPVPADVEVKPSDIAAGLILPGRDGGYRMRVTRTNPNDGLDFGREGHISEGHIIQKIIEERCDIRRAGRIFTRKQAVAQCLVEHILMSANRIEAQASWITRIDVHDSGLDEALFLSMLAPHHDAEHARRGGKNIDQSDLAAHLVAYLEPATAADHVAHLHAHFNVKAVA
jgi:hypothetical protein